MDVWDILGYIATMMEEFHNQYHHGMVAAVVEASLSGVPQTEEGGFFAAAEGA